VLLVRGLQDVVRYAAGLGHAEIAMVNGLRNNHRHQAVPVGDFLGVAWLQRRRRRQEVALPVQKPKDVGNVACRSLA
jgi:hypothetical protein